CDAAAAELREAFKLCDDRQPPADPLERLFQFRRGDGTRRGEIDKQFWKLTDPIEACLATFIREHRSTFERLNGPRPPQTPESADVQPRQFDPVSVGIADLPHWARVAFAAYCARRVFAFFDAAWPNALPERRVAVERATTLAEQCAAAGRRCGDVETAANGTVQVAGAASLFALHGIRVPGDDEPHPPDGNSAVVVGRIAHSAGNAARAAN